MTRAILSLLCSTALTALAANACGIDEPLNSTPSTLPDAGSDVFTPPPPDGGKEAGPVIRTVETRPRFGTLDPGNYLLDGDFEYSGMDAVQYPWFGVEHTFVVTGARCSRGLRCIEVPENSYVFGIFVWPDAATIDVAYAAKPNGTGNCADEVGGLVIPLDEYPGVPQDTLVVSATDPEPGPDGWCHVTHNVPVPSDTGNVLWALLLAPRQKATGSILVDDASIRIPGSAGANALSLPLSADLSKLVARARADFAKRPPPPPRGVVTPVENRTGRRGFGQRSLGAAPR
jgi:hypothetical protein